MRERLIRPGGFELALFVSEYLHENKYAPSIREIAEFLGCGSTSTAVLWLNEYRVEGFIEWLPGQPRTYHVPYA